MQPHDQIRLAFAQLEFFDQPLRRGAFADQSDSLLVRAFSGLLTLEGILPLGQYGLGGFQSRQASINPSAPGGQPRDTLFLQLLTVLADR